jgi:ABC-2 type transport system permease protein
VSRFNPFFYLIDGFRYGFIGKQDGSVMIGVAYTLALAVSLSLVAYRIFRTGWRMKS